MRDINEAVKNLNYQGEVTKAVQDKVPKDKILEAVLAPVSAKVNGLNDTMAIFG